MARIERMFLVFALCFSSALRADVPAPELDILNPRPFGYVIGDVVERKISVQLPDTYTLDHSSLRPAGLIDRWIEARPARIEESAELNRTRYRIALAYQILGSPESVTTLVLPEIDLTFRRAGGQIVAPVPDWPITVAPLTPPTVLARAGLPELRPDVAPSLIPMHVLELRLGAYTALGALVLLYLGYRRFGWFNFRGAGPFARAYRDLKRSLGNGGDAHVAVAMRRMHRAFDETAGRSVFAGRLDEFFSTHPRFADLRQPIESFFHHSREEFFGASSTGSTHFPSLLALCRDCYRCERRRP